MGEGVAGRQKTLPEALALFGGWAGGESRKAGKKRTCLRRKVAPRKRAARHLPGTRLLVGGVKKEGCLHLPGVTPDGVMRSMCVAAL